ncbi:MAG: hypothetical protein ABW220_03975 [Burkholderiaceae bacterium]
MLHGVDLTAVTCESSASSGGAADPRRLADQRAFLPSALELQETQLHPAPQCAAMVICALFVIAILWAILRQGGRTSASIRSSP